MVEIKPDGHLYLPEIQYRRILKFVFQVFKQQFLTFLSVMPSVLVVGQ